MSEADRIEDQDQLMQFADSGEDEEVVVPSESSPWKVLIVDDDQSVHDVTMVALKRFLFYDRPLQYFHAYSAREAREVMRTESDIALILLDVVMEEEHAGLHFVKYVRQQLKNPFVRIVLRTGHPGQAPEERVFQDYDINDYKEKTELTTKKLFSTIYASLRSYRDIMRLEHTREGLERIIHASESLFQIHSMDEFASGLLIQLLSILALGHDAFFGRQSGLVVNYRNEKEPNNEGVIVAATGNYRSEIGKPINHVADEQVIGQINRAIHEQSSVFEEQHCTIFFHDNSGNWGIAYLSGCGCGAMEEPDRQLLEMFCKDISIAYANVSLEQEIEQTQSEVIYMLGDVAESRSGEVHQHMVRMAMYAELIGRRLGLDEHELTLLRNASPMHDIGKVGIMDQILMKTGRLTEEEFESMKAHTQLGYDILKGSRRPLLQAAAVIAHQHHERWDGSGYPQGLAGENIHLYGRITAIADVFDALHTRRAYKPAWSFEEAVDYLDEQRGKHFDPQLIDAFMGDLEEVKRISAGFPG